MGIRAKCPTPALALLFLTAGARLEAACPAPPEPSVQEIHEGSLLLSGSQVLTVQNKLLIVHGEIRLSGAAQLIVKDSIIDVQFYPESDIFLSDTASLTADNSVFRSTLGPNYFTSLHAGGHSQLTLRQVDYSTIIGTYDDAKARISSSCVASSRPGIVQVKNNASVLVEDSVVGRVNLDFHGQPPVTLSNLQPGYFDHWSAKETVSPNLTFDLVLNRTQIRTDPGAQYDDPYGWSIWLVGNGKATITDSVLANVTLELTDSRAELSGLRLQQPLEFQYAGIQMHRTVVSSSWCVIVGNTDLTLADSSPVTVDVIDGKSPVLIRNTQLGEVYAWNYQGTVTFEGSWTGPNFPLKSYQGSDFLMQGELQINQLLSYFTPESKIRRRYQVFVKDSGGRAPLAGFALSLAKDGKKVWSGVTGPDGMATFDIAFDANNFKDTWLLSVGDATLGIQKQISLGSSTPIVLEPLQCKDGRTWPVVHVAANGQNFGDGSIDRPYPSLQAGADSLGGLGIVRVAPGRYTESVALRDQVWLVGAGPEVTTIEGSIDATSVRGAGVSGFSIRRHSSESAAVSCRNSCLTLVRNVMADGSRFGVNNQNCTLSLINNVIAKHQQSAIAIRQGSYASIMNNIFTDNGPDSAPASSDTSSHADLDYNDFWHSAKADYEGVTAGPHDIHVDPRFVDAGGGDYRLAPGSPARDAGNPAAEYNDEDGSRNDLGAGGGPAGLPGGVPGLSCAVPAIFPQITHVYNAASFLEGAAAPGEWVAITGTNLGPANYVLATGSQRGLGGSKVFFNGVEAFLTYTSATQINALVPYAAGGKADAVVQYNGMTSPTFPLLSTDSAPGILTQQYGPGQVWAINNDGTWNSPKNPVARGSGYIQFFATGQGLVSPAGEDGEIISTPKNINLPAKVSIGGIDAQLIFQPLLIYTGEICVGVWIPSNAPTGGNVPLVLTIGNASSRNDATIAVQ